MPGGKDEEMSPHHSEPWVLAQVADRQSRRARQPVFIKTLKGIENGRYKRCIEYLRECRSEESSGQELAKFAEFRGRGRCAYDDAGGAVQAAATLICG